MPQDVRDKVDIATRIISELRKKHNIKSDLPEDLIKGDSDGWYRLDYVSIPDPIDRELYKQALGTIVASYGNRVKEVGAWNNYILREASDISSTINGVGNPRLKGKHIILDLQGKPYDELGRVTGFTGFTSGGESLSYTPKDIFELEKIRELLYSDVLEMRNGKNPTLMTTFNLRKPLNAWFQPLSSKKGGKLVHRQSNIKWNDKAKKKWKPKKYSSYISSTK